MSKSTVDKFFNRQPIQLDSLKAICEALRIEDWRTIAELEPLVAQCASEASKKEAELDVVEAIASQPMNTSLTAARHITVASRENGEVQFEIVLRGDIASIDDQVQKTLETIFRRLSGSTITITDIKAGSIRIKLQGSPEDAARLIDRLTSGELTEVNGLPIENIQILSQNFLEEIEQSSFDKKWDLVREISTHPVQQWQLSGADLSDADLRGADLSDADLRGADLSDADLSGADLSDADLSGADLRGADLSGADLSGADLSGADLSDADLSDADLALVLDLARALARDLARDLDLARTLAYTRLSELARDRTSLFELAHDLARILDLSLALARDLDYLFAHALARDLDLDHLFDHARDLANELVIDLAHARDLDLDHLFDHGRDLANELAHARLSDLTLSLHRARAHARQITLSLHRARICNTNRKEANLSGAIVENARFGEGIGLTEAEKLDLQQRGAIFNESIGDREFTLR
ncbi:pentapeptide repeat-containing protein [Trichocoleus desertorum AS-A10]|uniref:pentapeptide repeat-containing protein n=1 Tax=Trichocoleus desertorum TaxID=1481672 RepID=UPI003298C4D1